MKGHCTVSPLGSLLEDLRAERAYSPVRRALRARVVIPRPARPSGAPEPDLRLEAGVVSGAASARPRRPWRWATSLVLHGGFVAAVVAVPLLMSDDLPSPVTGAKVFFVQAMAPPPPPAPPAPRRAAAPTAVRPSASATRATAPAPDVTRPEIKPEDVIEPAPPALAAVPLDEGVPGGVDEGVPGGIVGGVIEKVSASEPVSPTLRVGGAIKEPRKLKNVAPVYPDVAARGMVEGVVILEIAIQPSGHVDDVRVLRSIPLLDAAAVAAARQWVFAPTLYRGVPVSVTMTVSVRFSLTQGASAS